MTASFSTFRQSNFHNRHTSGYVQKYFDRGRRPEPKFIAVSYFWSSHMVPPVFWNIQNIASLHTFPATLIWHFTQLFENGTIMAIGLKIKLWLLSQGWCTGNGWNIESALEKTKCTFWNSYLMKKVFLLVIMKGCYRTFLTDQKCVSGHVQSSDMFSWSTHSQLIDESHL